MPFHRRLACKLNYFQSIILMFAAVILIGAALLMLPISAQERTVTPFHEALFTATSAVCVTGLVVRDTASHWSAFGQAVLMVLIQIGGLGVITVGASFSLLSGRRISLSQRGRMQELCPPPSGWHCAADRLCDPYLFDDRRIRRALYAPGFLPGFRRFRDMESRFSFRLRFLQCRL